MITSLYKHPNSLYENFIKSSNFEMKLLFWDINFINIYLIFEDKQVELLQFENNNIPTISVSIIEIINNIFLILPHYF